MKKNSVFLETAEKENAELQKELKAAKETIDQIKTGEIDALVTGTKKTIKVYTENSADKTYRILIERMHEGAVTLANDGTILYCNSFFANLVNVPLQSIMGTQLSRFIDKPSKKMFEDLVRSGWKNYVKEELNVYGKNGKVVPVLISLYALTLDDNFVLSVIFTDLTLRNKNQEELKLKALQLEQKNKELEIVIKDLTTFTYVSSHDLQEPLRKIKAFVALLLEEEKVNLSSDGKNYLERIYETAKQMRALIEDLLTYSRTKSSDRKIEKIDMNLIVNEIKKDFEESIKEKKASIETEGLCELNVISFQFRQLMFNLVSNSLKFSRPGVPPIITIKSEVILGKEMEGDLSPELNYCHITYKDNGIGFDPAYKDRIFEVFQRLHSKEEYEGTGMGLAICKRIVENHNGIITAKGVLNEGATFDIYLPAGKAGIPLQEI